MSAASDARDDRTVQAQAADWVARLYSGNASKADEARLQAWLDEDPHHLDEYNRMLAIWDMSGQDRIKGAYRTSTHRGSRTPLKDWRALMALAASVLIVLAGTVYLTTSPPAPEASVQAYKTTVGETRRLALADGSIVTLNTASRVFIDYGDGMRRAILDRGEAFFEVAKDPDRPFVVTAGTQSVTAVGTQFNVHRQGTALTVAVVEGVVAVHETLDPEQLEADARDVFHNRDETADLGFAVYTLRAGTVGTFERNVQVVGDIVRTDTRRHQAWRDGVLRVTDVTLEALVADLSRYTTRSIEFADPDAAALTVSGVFHHGDLEGVLAGLQTALPIRIERRGDRVIIRASRQ